ncbi:MAG: heavy metal sensor histidine kinase [Planctomycetes bacterium]|nr:heavy metal sensor histidine kinase [Planctomycetota bacterium]
MKRLSIRRRLTRWYGGVLAGVLIAFSVAVYLIMRHHLLERVDAGLREELADVLSEVQRAEERKSMLMWLDRRFAHHEGFDFQITTSDGQRVFANPRLGERRLPMPSFMPHSDQTVFQTASLSGERRWRIVSCQVAGPDGMLRVQVARSLDFYDHEMGELLAVLALTGPLALLMALSGGYVLARRALAPVDRMTAAANQVTAQRLDQRLEVPNPDDEVGRLAQTLNGMLDRLERSFREMQRFTADASHELRTPLSVIRAEAEIALHKPISDAEKQDLLSNILEECQRLTWITDQLLTLCREDAGIIQFPRERIDLGHLVQQVAETMRPLAEAKNQRFSVAANGNSVVHGDPTRLRHVVYNLLDNAIKYTPLGGAVDVRVAPDDRAVHLVVQDNGIGIPPEHLPHVFERFYRVDKARSRAEGGAGLGLSIVQSIVRAHGGSVMLDSAPGEGTCCTVVLPQEACKGNGG